MIYAQLQISADGAWQVFPVQYIPTYINFYLIEETSATNSLRINTIVSGVKEGKPTVYSTYSATPSWVGLAKVNFYGATIY